MNNKIVIIGCTNKGKSSLFNKIVGRNIAIVYDRDGVTVDCRKENVEINGFDATIVDTPGFDECHLSENGKIQKLINKQIEKAIRQSDIVIHVIDAGIGYNNDDSDWVKRCQEQKKKIIVVANKTDLYTGINENCYRMSNDDVVLTSVKRNDGIGMLKATICEYLTDKGQKEQDYEDNSEVEICIIGKPNAGKSTLMNRICRENHSIISRDAGTTCDTITHRIKLDDMWLKISDTAGLRKRSQITDEVEKEAVSQSINAISQHGIALLVIDAEIGVSDQDVRLIELVRRRRRKQVIIINKWDKLDEDKKAIYRKNSEKISRNHAYIPTVFMSAKEDRQIKKLIRIIDKVNQKRSLPPMSYLTKSIQTFVEKHPAPHVNGRPIKIRVCYPNQKKFMSVTVQGKRVSELPLSYKKYLKNSLQELLEISGIDIEIIFKNDANPYE